MADYGHDKTDKMLKELERRIHSEYSGAAKEIQKKTRSYLKSFEKKDSEMLAKLNANEITQKDYLKWRGMAMATGQRWEALKDTIRAELENSNKIANAMITGHAQDVYALNHNYGMYEVEKGSLMDTSYTLYDRGTVERLMKDDPKMLPNPGKATSEKIRRGELKRWNNRQIQSVMTQSILMGDSIPDIAKRLAEKVGEANSYSHIRAARTMTTGAENAGRLDSYRRAEEMGIQMRKKWLATNDDRTREAHIELDGVSVPVDEPFENEIGEIMFPGDPDADDANIYNCRCTLVADFEGDEQGDDAELADMSFDEWQEAHESGADTFDLKEPRRPHVDDFGGYTEEYYAARDAYKAERASYQEAKEAWIDRAIPEKSMGLQELQDWCKSHDVNIYGDMSPVDGRCLTILTNRMDKLMTDFPEVAGYKKLRGLPAPYDKFEFEFENTHSFVAEASRGFRFGAIGQDARDFVAEYAEGVAMEYRVRGCGTADAIIDHEFGHSVQNWMNSREGIGARERVEMERDLLKTVGGKEGMSEYATTNPNELFAEAFCAWYGGEKTEFAKAMGDYLRRWGAI